MGRLDRGLPNDAIPGKQPGSCARHGLALVLAALAASAPAGCAVSASKHAGALLQTTFGQTHTVTSGNLSVELTIDPDGAGPDAPPLTLAFGGPFQSVGGAQASDFTLSLTAQGKTRSLRLISSGAAGYVVLGDTTYQLSRTALAKLEAKLPAVTAPATASSQPASLSVLGIQPLRWLIDPKVVGYEIIGGADTAHIRAGVNVTALLADLGASLSRFPALGLPGAAGGGGALKISPAVLSEFAHEVSNPSFDVWTGRSDHTMRRLQIELTLPLAGQVSAIFGGASRAGISLSVQYSELGVLQTVLVPSHARPYARLSKALSAWLASVEAQILGPPAPPAPTAGASQSPSPGSSPASTSSATATATAASGESAAEAYSECIQAAGNDLTKLQSCASLLAGQ